jgi:hypothetical protein
LIIAVRQISLRLFLFRFFDFRKFGKRYRNLRRSGLPAERENYQKRRR